MGEENQIIQNIKNNTPTTELEIAPIFLMQGEARIRPWNDDSYDNLKYLYTEAEDILEKKKKRAYNKKMKR